MWSQAAVWPLLGLVMLGDGCGGTNAKGPETAKPAVPVAGATCRRGQLVCRTRRPGGHLRPVQREGRGRLPAEGRLVQGAQPAGIAVLPLQSKAGSQVRRGVRGEVRQETAEARDKVGRRAFVGCVLARTRRAGKNPCGKHAPYLVSISPARQPRRLLAPGAPGARPAPPAGAGSAGGSVVWSGVTVSSPARRPAGSPGRPGRRPRGCRAAGRASRGSSTWSRRPRRCGSAEGVACWIAARPAARCCRPGPRRSRACGTGRPLHGARRTTTSAADWIRSAGLLGHHVGHHVDELGRQAGLSRRGSSGAQFAVGAGLVGRRAAGKRHLAGHRVVERAAQRVDVPGRRRVPRGA